MKKIGILILLVCFMISPLSVNAYVLNGLRVPNPQSVTYSVETNNATATYTEVDAVISAIPSWQIHCPELKIVRSNSNNYEEKDLDSHCFIYSNMNRWFSVI